MADLESIAATLTAGILQARATSGISGGGFTQAIAARSGGPDATEAVQLYVAVLTELRALPGSGASP